MLKNAVLFLFFCLFSVNFVAQPASHAAPNAKQKEKVSAYLTKKISQHEKATLEDFKKMREKELLSAKKHLLDNLERYEEVLKPILSESPEYKIENLIDRIDYEIRQISHSGEDYRARVIQAEKIEKQKLFESENHIYGLTREALKEFDSNEPGNCVLAPLFLFLCFVGDTFCFPCAVVMTICPGC